MCFDSFHYCFPLNAMQDFDRKYLTENCRRFGRIARVRKNKGSCKKIVQLFTFSSYLPIIQMFLKYSIDRKYCRWFVNDQTVFSPEYHRFFRDCFYLPAQLVTFRNQFLSMRNGQTDLKLRTWCRKKKNGGKYKKYSAVFFTCPFLFKLEIKFHCQFKTDSNFHKQ